MITIKLGNLLIVVTITLGAAWFVWQLLSIPISAEGRPLPLWLMLSALFI